MCCGAEASKMGNEQPQEVALGENGESQALIRGLSGDKHPHSKGNVLEDD